MATLVLGALGGHYLTKLKSDEDNSKRALTVFGPALGLSILLNVAYGWCLSRATCREAGLINAAIGRDIVADNPVQV